MIITIIFFYLFTFFTFFTVSSAVSFSVGNFRGNMAISVANMPIVTPRIIQPSHHAPNHRGSFFVITGCKLGSMYKLRQP